MPATSAKRLSAMTLCIKRELTDAPRSRASGFMLGKVPSLGALVLAVGVYGCAAPRTAPIVAEPVGEPRRALPDVRPTPTVGETLRFEEEGPELPRDRLSNVATEAGALRASWLRIGEWEIAKEAGKGMLWHHELRPQPALSFIRYMGAAFGSPGGQVSPRYTSAVTVMAHQSPHGYHPTGDQGQPFYYRDPTHYVEALIKPQMLEIWEANDAAPGQSRGWKRLYATRLETRAKESQRLGANVDTRKGTFTLLLNDKELTTVSSPIIKPGPAWVTLRAAGNQVSFDDWYLAPLAP
jgi:hypothetical protein